MVEKNFYTSESIKNEEIIEKIKIPNQKQYLLKLKNVYKIISFQ